ncbi:MAG: protein translocase subunit SecF, partial [Arthrobacter sp.]
MANFAKWGNDLYTGKRSYDFVGKYKIWFGIAVVGILLSIVVPFVKGGFNLGIDFRGGSEFTVSNVQNTDPGPGEAAVAKVAADADPRVTNIAPGTMRIQTERLDDDQTLQL